MAEAGEATKFRRFLTTSVRSVGRTPEGAFHVLTPLGGPWGPCEASHGQGTEWWSSCFVDLEPVSGSVREPGTRLWYHASEVCRKGSGKGVQNCPCFQERNRRSGLFQNHMVSAPLGRRAMERVLILEIMEAPLSEKPTCQAESCARIAIAPQTATCGKSNTAPAFRHN
jgi:hypothetical protein